MSLESHESIIKEIFNLIQKVEQLKESPENNYLKKMAIGNLKEAQTYLSRIN